MMTKQPFFRNRHLALILMFASILVYGFYVNYWYFGLSIVPIIYAFLNRVSIKRCVTYGLISIIPVLLMLLIREKNYIEQIGQIVDKTFHFSIRESIQSFVTNNYNQKTGAFINLVIFNVKSGEAWNVYHDMIDLSIVYLIVVSGFHISILRNLIKKCFKKIPMGGDIVSITLILFYCYLLNFAISVTRVLLMTILTIVIKKWIKNRFDILALSGMLTMLFGPSCVMNLGFCMSYLCTATIIYVYSLQIRNPIFEGLLVNLSATVVSLPFVLQMNQAISLWTVINSYAFSYLFIFVFIYLLITFWIVWIAPIQAFIVTVVFKIIQLSWSINVVIYWHQLPIYLIPLYYLGSYLSIRMLKFI